MNGAGYVLSTRREQIITSGKIFGQAVQVDEVTQPSVTFRHVQASVGGEPGRRSPFLDDLRANAPREIVDEAIALVKEYADIFARSDLDLGEFTALNHCIDTDAGRPVKQRMRRTPTVLQGEEEGHLDKFSRRCDSAINF